MTTTADAPTPADEAPRTGLGLLSAAAAVVVWGASSVLIKQVADLDGLAIACYRIWLGAVVVSIAFRVSGGRITRELLRRSALGGVAFALDIILFFMAVQETSVANATVIGALQPVFVLLVVGRLFGEHPRAVELLWGAVAIGGAAMVVLGGDGGGANSLGGDLLAVGALIAWTAYFIWSKSARRHLTAFAYLTGMAIVAAVFVLPLALVFNDSLGSTDANGWLTIVYITLVNGLLGHFLMSWAHGHVTLLAVSLLTLGIPVVSAAAAALWLDEPLTAPQVAGMAVVLAALSIVSWLSARRAPALVAADIEALDAAPHP
ncbi:MAG: DMT family transporter [Acidimicrobiales bacterium]